MKNILRENMLRFGTKNLSEQFLKKLFGKNDSEDSQCKGVTDTNPRENLQRMLLEACQRVNSPAVPATPTFTVESKVPKKIPNISTIAADEQGKFDELVFIIIV